MSVALWYEDDTCVHAELSDVLRGSVFDEYLRYVPSGLQLTTFMATVWGIKPAMDVWVDEKKSDAFLDYCRRLGLYTAVQGYIDRHAFQQLDVPSDRFTTTRAVWYSSPYPHTEAHIFLSTSPTHLQHTVACGWYPVVIDGYLIEKHYVDHSFFGSALGYPACCQQFFQQRNNWHNDNTYYAIWEQSTFHGDWQMNSFLRHTPYTLMAHMACSVQCQATRQLVQNLWRTLVVELPQYAHVLQKKLQQSILCLSEVRLYTFGVTERIAQGLCYDDVQPVNPTSEDDTIVLALRRGNKCLVERNIVRVFDENTQIFAYMAHNDRYGPECPFIVHFS